MNTSLPKQSQQKSAIVYTSKAMCRDCYRCVRVCPVTAIKMENGQAQVLAEQCIACGTCIAECPQNAKAYRTDYGKVLMMLEQGDQIAVSLAPSFAAFYTKWEQKRLPSALRSMGFSYIGETAIGAWHTATASRDWIEAHPDKKHICTACPAVVNYIAQYETEHLPELVPVVSPMIAHARMLKQQAPERKVVFVGPCIAKKSEAEALSNQAFVDAVLTFGELEELFRIKQVSLNQCEESEFDENAGGESRLFPLEGGLLRTAQMQTDMLQADVIAMSGFEELCATIESMKGEPQKAGAPQSWVLEPLFCKYGCINGPSERKPTAMFAGRNRIIEYANAKPGTQMLPEQLYDKLQTRYKRTGSMLNSDFSAQQIQEVLLKTGKHKPEDELNCMACGFASCREKAIAVLQGMAEPEMCMPYMRRMAEKKFDLMIEHDPNGIILLNSQLEIVHMNAAFKKMFSCTDALLGRKISYLIDPDSFEKLSAEGKQGLRQTVQYTSYNLICHQISYAIPEMSQFVGIFVDITDFTLNKDKLTELKSETIYQAQELMDHQISMAQDLARFLGENTARGEALMQKLIDSIQK